MVISSLKIRVSQAKYKDALDTIHAILGPTCAQPGCINMAFYQDTNDIDYLFLLEEWKDWKSLENHIRSKSYRNILELMELSTEQPEFKLITAASTKGMEVIEKLRR
jgi:quinol monooxygenase YgiN